MAIVFPNFGIGSKFSSYLEFEKAKESYENENFAVLIKSRSTKYHEGHKNRHTLVYKYLIFECKKGHKHQDSTAKGIRPNVKTGKLGCNFKLKLSANRGFLVVKESNLEHTNHELTEERFNHLPEKLRLNPEEIKEVELCIKLGLSKKQIQAHLMQKRGGKPVMLKTLHNMSAKLRKNWQSDSEAKLQKNMQSDSEAKLQENMQCDSEAKLQENMQSDSEAKLQENRQSDSEAKLQENMQSDSEAKLQENRQSDSEAKLQKNMQSNSEAKLQENMQSDSKAKLQENRQSDSEKILDSMDEVEIEIRKNLSQFAANHVCEEYKKSRHITFSTVEDDFYTLKTQSMTITATESSCTCGLPSSMGLPCRHILAVRREKNLPIYISSLSRLQWARPYVSVHPIFKNTGNQQGHFDIVPKTRKKCKKYSKARKLTKNINSVLSTLPNDKYKYYVSKLKEFQDLLLQNKLIHIAENSLAHNEDDEMNEQLQNKLSVVVPDVQAPSTSRKLKKIELTSKKLTRPIKKQRNTKGFSKTIKGKKENTPNY